MSKRKTSPARGKRPATKARKPASKSTRSKRSAPTSTKRKRAKPAAAKAARPKVAPVTRSSPPETLPPPNPLASDDREHPAQHELPGSPSPVQPRPDVERVVAVKRRRSMRHGAEI